MSGKQKAVWIFLTAIVIAATIFIKESLANINTVSLIASSALTFLFPKTFTMGVSDDKNAGVTLKTVGVAVAFCFVLLGIYLNNSIMAGIYLGLILSYLAKTIARKVVK